MWFSTVVNSAAFHGSEPVRSINPVFMSLRESSGNVAVYGTLPDSQADLLFLPMPQVFPTPYTRCARRNASGKTPMASLHAWTPGGTRDCGPCTACCTHLPIPAGAIGPGRKPAGVVCPHRCATGCRIYTRRPRLCVDFRCAWLSDESWPPPWQPVRSGLMCLREELDDGLPAAAVYEIRPGALQAPPAPAIMEELQRTTVVIAVIDKQNRRRRVSGRLQIHTTGPALPRPHFYLLR